VWCDTVEYLAVEVDTTSHVKEKNDETLRYVPEMRSIDLI
jgi:hypothetical protein